MEQILEEIYDQAELFACDDDGTVNNGEHIVSDSHVVILPTEGTLQEVVVSLESHHKLNNVTNPTPTHVPSSEEQSHKLPD